ncbi:hypothetical protein CC80DRAFT_236828 [Byssothecium circinans]|uniref:Uncharacterized protein n=1 Tax=Byssothecium circinans TaxID=147558 RepID=A0A6A5U8B8_9PLEO|nr:hypothetical protein CC80DRAFT_236828 [Byssothecium circinans]
MSMASSLVRRSVHFFDSPLASESCHFPTTHSHQTTFPSFQASLPHQTTLPSFQASLSHQTNPPPFLNNPSHERKPALFPKKPLNHTSPTAPAARLRPPAMSTSEHIATAPASMQCSTTIPTPAESSRLKNTIYAANSEQWGDFLPVSDLKAAVGTTTRSLAEHIADMPAELQIMMQEATGDAIVEQYFEHVDKLIELNTRGRGKGIKFRQRARDFSTIRAAVDHVPEWPSFFPSGKIDFVAAAMARKTNFIIGNRDLMEVKWLDGFLDAFSCHKLVREITFGHDTYMMYGHERLFRKLINLERVTIGLDRDDVVHYNRIEHKCEVGSAAYLADALERHGKLDVLDGKKHLREIVFVQQELSYSRDAQMLQRQITDIIIEFAAEVKQRLIRGGLTKVEVFVDSDVEWDRKGEAILTRIV